MILMGFLGKLLTIFAIVVVIVLLYPYIQSLLNGISIGNFTIGTNYSIVPVSQPTYTPSNATVEYALSLINNDRTTFNLNQVSASNETSAQQHADSMLQNDYFSHWDIYGMKPYMRYTLVGGTGAVEENIGYIYQSSGINVSSALKQIEYNFVYNDVQCCNNGHRDNILNQYHNEVSLGIAYNRTTIYFVEDFIDNYIEWKNGSPGIGSRDNVTLDGIIVPGYNLSSIEIGYDPTPQDLSTSQLEASPYNSSYSYGSTVAGIAYRSGFHDFYYPTLYNINASAYTIHANVFDIAFNASGLFSKYGAGAYTIEIWLQNNTENFEAATYTIFVNGRGEVYIPQNV
jgi:uncharacterized protein YkwD